MDDDSLQDYRRGVPGDIQILREDTTVATAPSVASQGSAAVFQRRARCTLLEIEQDEVVVRKGDRGLPGSKIYVANRIAATQSLSSKFLGSFHLQSKNAAGKNVQKSKHIQDEFVSNLDAEHLLIQESLEERGKLLVDPPSRTTIVVGQNASVVSCWLTLVTKARHLPFV